MIDFKWVQLREALDEVVDKNFPELLDGYYGNIWNKESKMGNQIIHAIRIHLEGE